jgi:hypothetical protein
VTREQVRMTRTHIGSVNILQERVYPRYPVTPPRELTTADEFVSVDTGKWPVYRGDDGLIYWEMEGELIKIESTFEDLGDSMFMSRQRAVPQGSRVIFRSTAYTDAEFSRFCTTDPLVVGDDSVRRLVFEVTP